CKDWEEIIKYMILAAQATVALGWKDYRKWEVKKWYEYLAEYMLHEYIYEKRSKYSTGRLKKTWMQKWERLIEKGEGNERYKVLNHSLYT
ncbi:hypothetical protein, partial [Pseudomonas lurida]|uniref:hypothetical protein n=1 Tax=Pseudomonas lurida TaxID=244566 RepID=UPI0034D95610